MHKKVLAGLIALGFATGVQAQQKYEVKVATFVGPQHFMSKWLVAWGEKLEKASGGRLALKHFPGSQMGPTPVHYDLGLREADADLDEVVAVAELLQPVLDAARVVARLAQVGLQRAPIGAARRHRDLRLEDADETHLAGVGLLQVLDDLLRGLVHGAMATRMNLCDARA